MLTVSEFSRVRRGIVALVSTTLLAVLLAGCAASSGYTTRAYPTVPKPTSDNQDYAVWAAYYTDQFQSLGDKVVPPPPSHPESAKKAFADAKLAWEQQVSAGKHQWEQGRKKSNTMWYAIGGTAAALLLFNLAF